MSKRKIVWLLSAILVFVIFYYLIPIGLINKTPFTFAIIGSLVFVFFCLQAIVDFKNYSDFAKPMDTSKTWKQKISLLFIIPAIAIVFVFTFQYDNRERAELTENGEFATGVIINGTGLTTFRKGTSRGGMYQLSIKFNTKEGEEISLFEDVTESEFDNVRQGNLVDLVYSSKNPKIIQLLLNKETVKSFPFKGIDQKDLGMEDLQKLVGLSNDSLGIKLNRLSYRWDYSDQDLTWSNKFYDLYIKSENNRLTLVSFNLSYDSQKEGIPTLDKYERELIPLGYSQTSSDSDTKSFSSDKYNVTLKIIDTGNIFGQQVVVEKIGN